MPNPWLTVPLDDYERHMGAAGVHQLDPLAILFRDALEHCRPAAVAVLGVAGGNGLEHIDRRRTRRVVAIDLNPRYLEAVAQRHPAWPTLELHCCDLTEPLAPLEPVDLVHAALIFEHAGEGQCLDNALSLVAPRGTLSVVLQLPSEAPAVDSDLDSIRQLRNGFHLVSPERLTAILGQRGFRLTHQRTRQLRGGKAFWAALFAVA